MECFPKSLFFPILKVEREKKRWGRGWERERRRRRNPGIEVASFQQMNPVPIHTKTVDQTNHIQEETRKKTTQNPKENIMQHNQTSITPNQIQIESHINPLPYQQPEIIQNTSVQQTPVPNIWGFQNQNQQQLQRQKWDFVPYPMQIPNHHLM